MVVWWVPWLIGAIVAVAVISNLPSGKTADPDAVTLSEFGIPQISENTTKRVLFGTKWITDPLVADYGNYSREAIWKEP